MSERSAKPPLLLLVDGHALAYRAYHALREPMSAPDGEPTGATFGFTNMLLAALNTHRPTHLAVAFDRGRSGREALYPPYKANRAERPLELDVQLQRIAEIVAAFNIPVYTLDGFEADDVLGTLTAQAETAGVDSLVITGDSDLLQMVGPHTRVAISGRRMSEVEIYDAARVRERYGVEPVDLAEWKGLKGDSSDNILGVSGIGEKGATELIQAHGTVDGVLAAAPGFKPGRLRDNLIAQADQARLSARLCRIMRDLPVTLDMEQVALTGYDREAVLAIFRRLSFRNLMDRLPALDASAPGDAPAAPAPAAPSGDYRLVADLAELEDLTATWAAAPRLAFDTETTGVDPMRARLVGIAISDAVGRGWYIAVGHGATAAEGDPSAAPAAHAQLTMDFGVGATGAGAAAGANATDPLDGPPDGDPPAALPDRNLPWAEVLRLLGPVLQGPAIKVAHHAKYDLTVLLRAGLPVSAPVFDTLVAAWLVDPGRRGLGLKDLAFTELGVEMTPISALIGKGKGQRTMAEVNPVDAAAYAGADVDMTLRLAHWAAPHLEERGARELFEQLEMPLMWVLAEMERTGIRVDAEVLAEIARDLNARAAALEDQIFAGVGHRFNLASPKQLSEVLFGELGIPPTRKTDTGFSTNADALADLAAQYPIIQTIQDHRHVRKLLGTYVEALPLMINYETMRIHTSWQQTGTVTGRLSSTEPNLQNIPVRSELGGQIRRAFVAEQGWLILAADYSQMELRILAALSGDEALTAVYAEGGDVHADTAAYLFQKDPSAVTANERRLAKIVNFGIVYGMGAFGLSRSTGWSRSESAAFIDRYFTRYAGVKAYFDRQLADCAQTGYVSTLLGRRRYFPMLREGSGVDANTRARMEREALNAPIQGGAADITKRAMIDLSAALKVGGYRARLLLQVHDELLLEVPPDEIDAVAALTRAIMTGCVPLPGVSLAVDVAVGVNWGELVRVT